MMIQFFVITWDKLRLWFGGWLNSFVESNTTTNDNKRHFLKKINDKERAREREDTNIRSVIFSVGNLELKVFDFQLP